MFSSHINPDAARLGEQTKKAAAKYITLVAPAAKLLAYAESVDSRSKLSSQFPKDRPLIEQPAVGMANDILRFIMLHELSHVVLDHKPAWGLKSQNQEFEADKLATTSL